MNAYQQVAEDVRLAFVAERQNAELRGASADRLHHLDLAINEAEDARDALRDCSSKGSAIATVTALQDRAQGGDEKDDAAADSAGGAILLAMAKL